MGLFLVDQQGSVHKTKIVKFWENFFKLYGSNWEPGYGLISYKYEQSKALSIQEKIWKQKSNP